MSRWQFILDSLRHYRWLHLAVAAGVAVATAVITGALLVGDSMRGSLRDRALDGLGRVDVVLLAEQPFRAELARETLDKFAAETSAQDSPGAYQRAVPVLTLRGALTAGSGKKARRATGLTVYGVPDDFWSLANAGEGEAPAEPNPRTGVGSAGASPSQGPTDLAKIKYEIAIGPDIAEELGVTDGDAVLLRLPTLAALPADSALGEKDETALTRRLKATVVEDAATPMLHFSPRPSQQTPRNVFLPLEQVQELLNLPQQANAVLFAGDGNSADAALPQPLRDQLTAALQPKLADYGLSLERIRGGENAFGGYLRLSGRELVLPEAAVNAAATLFASRDAQPVVTYLANTIRVGERQIAYSTVAGVDSVASLGPVLAPDGQPIELADDEIALNSWAAEALDAQVGDAVTLTYYQPETMHGELQQADPVRLTLRAIVPLEDDTGDPTPAADPAFAPELPGVTDQQSIDEWDVPFDLVEDVSDAEETYWDERRTTPKAFVSHALAARLWGTRWGTDSVLRIPAGDLTAEQASAQLAGNLQPQQLGLVMLPVKQLALDASSGTTPFDGLFLGFSFFLMASAVMLIVLLFRLGAEQRASESGLLLAAGFSPRTLRRLALLEGGAVAALGALVGAAAGVAYAWIMVYGLNNWWSAATNAPFLRLHVEPRSVFIGLAAGVLVAVAAMAWSLRKLVKLPPRQLLAGDAEPREQRLPTAAGKRSWTAWVAGVAAVGLAVAGRSLEGEAQAGAFFGGGAMALIAALAAVRQVMRRPSAPTARLTLDGLSLRNARRNPGRTQLALGLAAVASFLIVALSAFRLAPTDSGTGGFALLATADLPLQYDLGTSAGRDELGFSTRDNELMQSVRVVSCRVHDGEDASCLNLYQTTQPRVIGVPSAIADDDKFAWGPTAELPAGDSPWSLLQSDLGADDSGRPIVPMVLDRNTAMYSLKLYAVGDRLTLRDEFDQPRTFEVVGLLANSILQGEVLVDAQEFEQLYPSTGGSRYFLIGPVKSDAKEDGADKSSSPAELATLLESQLEDFGFDAVDARGRLADLMAVQNTYLSTFQSLGALGLLLGVIGLAVVQIRSVLERRGELALMRATGFRQQRLGRMVLTENFALLGGGLAIGCLAALAAVLPHAWSQGASVPWLALAKLVAAVAAAGVLSGWLAARQAVRVPLLPALRGE